MNYPFYVNTKTRDDHFCLQQIFEWFSLLSVGTRTQLMQPLTDYTEVLLN